MHTHFLLRRVIPFSVVAVLLLLTLAPTTLRAMLNQSASGSVLILVTTTDDEYNNDGDCALREAMIAANRNITVSGCLAGTSTGDTILVPAGVYTLTLSGANEELGETGDLDLTEATVIQGTGSATTIINGAQVDRVLDVRAPSSARVVLRDITITNGGAGESANAGAGIRSTADLRLERVEVRLNWGGGVLANNGIEVISSTIAANFVGPIMAGMDGGAGLSTAGTVLIENSLIGGNTAFHYDSATSYGGGWLHRSGTAIMRNSTMSHNGFALAPFPPPDAGYGVGANLYSTGVVTIYDSTIADGFAEDTVPTMLPASLEGTSITVRNTILVSNGHVPNCLGPVLSLGFNMTNDNTCTFLTQEGDVRLVANIHLGTLQDNGGPTFTRALGVGSAAIDTGPLTNCPATDQRGTLRPQDGDGDMVGACDRGAYEVGDGAPEPPGTATPTIPPTATASPEPTPSVAPSVTPSVTRTPFRSPTPQPTYTPLATYTPYPTLTPLPTYIPYPTLTPLPTYTPYPPYTPLPTYIPYPTLTPLPTYTSYPTLTPIGTPISQGSIFLPLIRNE